MSFSDEDLRRLKDWLVGGIGPTDWSERDQDRFIALIDRLEAAEYALIRFQIIPAEDRTSGIEEALQLWLKAAGRKE